MVRRVDGGASRRTEAGQGLTEYGVIISLISVMLLAVFPLLQPLWSNDYWKFAETGGGGKVTLASSLGVPLPGSGSSSQVAGNGEDDADDDDDEDDDQDEDDEDDEDDD